MKIRDLAISARARNCLISSGFETIEELSELSDEKLLAIHNFDYKCLQEIRNALENYRPNNAVINNAPSIEYENGDFKKTELQSNYHGSFSIRSFVEVIKPIPVAKKGVIKGIDHTVVPFSGDKVNETSVISVYRELQNIEHNFLRSRAENGHSPIVDRDVDVDEYDDVESELFYEQGKYLSNIEWTGEEFSEVPQTEIIYCTYRKLNIEQLQYYLYWRTSFRNGIFISTGYKSFYFLYAYELLAELGPFSPSENLAQLERLYNGFRDEGLTNELWVYQFAVLHELQVSEEFKQFFNKAKWIKQTLQRNQSLYQALAGDLDKTYEIMLSKSYYKLKTSKFITKYKCIDGIKEVVKSSIPPLKCLFKEHQLCFDDFLIGRYDITVYEHSILRPRVIEKLLLSIERCPSLVHKYKNSDIYITDRDGNIKKQTATNLRYDDPYLAEYILRYAEMLFRRQMGYMYITIPSKLQGALRMKFADGYSYILSVDPYEREKEKSYISLYDDISKIIENSANKYFAENNFS